MTLQVQDFIARFLQHVLPRGFTKIRYYGLLSPTSRQDLERARELLESAASQIPRSPAEEAGVEGCPSTPAQSALPPPRLCPVCRRGYLYLLGTAFKPRAPP